MKGYENALQKMVRLLRELNQELVKKGEIEHIFEEIDADGSGRLIYFNETNTKQILFCFGTIDQLMEYLEAGNLKRILMSRG